MNVKLYLADLEGISSENRVILWNLNFADFVFASYSRLPGNDFLWKKTGTNFEDISFGLYNMLPVVLETREAFTIQAMCREFLSEF